VRNLDRVLLSDLLDVATVLQLAAAVGGAGVLSFLAPQYLQPITSLPPGLRLLFGFFVFLFTFVLFLVGIKAVVTKWFSSEPGPPSGPNVHIGNVHGNFTVQGNLQMGGQSSLPSDDSDSEAENNESAAKPQTKSSGNEPTG
jgi:hypothetical protein